MDDPELLDALRTAVDALDPMPASVAQTARLAGSWSFDGIAPIELKPALAGATVRGIGEPIEFSFEFAGHSVALSLLDMAGGQVAITVLTTPRVPTIELHIPAAPEPQSFTTDDAGTLAITTEQRHFSLRVMTTGGAAARTPLLHIDNL